MNIFYEDHALLQAPILLRDPGQQFRQNGWFVSRCVSFLRNGHAHLMSKYCFKLQRIVRHKTPPPSSGRDTGCYHNNAWFHPVLNRFRLFPKICEWPVASSGRPWVDSPTWRRTPPDTQTVSILSIRETVRVMDCQIDCPRRLFEFLWALAIPTPNACLSIALTVSRQLLSLSLWSPCLGLASVGGHVRLMRAESGAVRGIHVCACPCAFVSVQCSVTYASEVPHFVTDELQLFRKWCSAKPNFHPYVVFHHCGGILNKNLV